jgi:hypothetical protein
MKFGLAPATKTIFIVIEKLESVELLNPIQPLNRQGAKDAKVRRGFFS